MKTLFALLAFFVICSLPVYALPNELEPGWGDYNQRAPELEGDVLAGRYARVEKFLSDAVAEKVQTRGGSLYADRLLQAMFVNPNLELKAKLDRWVKESGSSAYPYILRATYLRKRAWDARGEKFAAKTSDSAMNSYSSLIRESAADFDKAYQRDSNNPLTLIARVSTAKELGTPAAEVEKYFKVLTTYQPVLYQAYTEKLLYLLPQWGGSEPDALAFARSSAAIEDESSALPWLIVTVHSSLCSQHGGKEAYLGNESVWNEVRAAGEKAIARFPRAAFYPLELGKLAYVSGRIDLARTYFSQAKQREPKSSDMVKDLQRYEGYYRKKGLPAF